MQTLILCGGMGTRLREETEYRPKPMVEIGGRPILWHIMKCYAAHGFTDFVLCLGYRGETIKEYFLNYEAMNNDFTIELGKPNAVCYHDAHGENGWRVTLVDTGLQTMTGARIKRASRHVSGDRFMVTYGDGVSNVDLRNLVAFHERAGTLATVTGVHPSSRFGELMVTGDRVSQFSEKPQTHKGLINGGFFVFERQALEYLSDDANCVLEREPLERLSNDGQLAVYQHAGFWQCMDTYRDYQHLNHLWESGGAEWKQW
ncbi:MAG TPA: glucose-1-phosphate cytidylyltransferase [Vicinamibacterales bacterium]|nr:glucose-1-phosphate cytidylyltransferase [Vicinamibacterales bacterium]